MSLFYLLLKVFPAFGLGFGVFCFDISRNLKRKGNKAWIGIALIAVVNLALTGIWIYFRGDRHADLWFGRVMDWLQHK